MAQPNSSPAQRDRGQVTLGSIEWVAGMADVIERRVYDMPAASQNQ